MDLLENWKGLGAGAAGVELSQTLSLWRCWFCSCFSTIYQAPRYISNCLFNNATLRGFEAMNMVRKGQVRGINKGDIQASIEFLSQIFGVAQ
ncbi:MAG: hypothetical protein JO235_04875 [Chroococcidiopsidaceae cyanobacterium CP_BM_RX_35]|nr:hypothetical protein [Chroococcidiopsidaceae cyanobacterium CP_BM_RX_35]